MVASVTRLIRYRTVWVLPVPRAVQQDAAFEVLAVPLQLLAALRVAHHVPLDAVQHTVGQHDVVGGQLGPGQERHHLVAAVLADVERQQLSSVDVDGADQAFHLFADRGRDGPVGGQHPQQATWLRGVLGGATQRDHDRLAIRRPGTDQAELDDVDRGVRAGRGRRVLDGAQLVLPPALGERQHVQQVLVTVHAAGDAEPVALGAV
jgi:hypothetical protein